MTAQTVNGIAVVSDRPATADMPNKLTGEPLPLYQTRHLVLADGSEIYGCAHCDYTHPKKHGVRPHLKTHKPKPRAEEPAEIAADVPGIRVEDTPHITFDVAVNGAPLYEVVERLQAYDRLAIDPADAQRRLRAVDGIQADRDKWKARAQKAERDLKKIRDALGRG